MSCISDIVQTAREVTMITAVTTIFSLPLVVINTRNMSKMREKCCILLCRELQITLEQYITYCPNRHVAINT